MNSLPNCLEFNLPYPWQNAFGDRSSGRPSAAPLITTNWQIEEFVTLEKPAVKGKRGEGKTSAKGQAVSCNPGIRLIAHRDKIEYCNAGFHPESNRD